MPGPWFFLRAWRSVSRAMADVKKLRLIQCGLGGMGRAWRDNAASQSPDFDVVAVVDVNDTPLREGGEQLRVPPERRFTSLADAIARVEADAVLTVTPPPVHVDHAKLAFAAGLHL